MSKGHGDEEQWIYSIKGDSCSFQKKRWRLMIREACTSQKREASEEDAWQGKS